LVSEYLSLNNRNSQSSIPGRSTINRTGPAINVKRPFWLLPTNYYILSLAMALALFFAAWAVLREGGDEAPWIPAGLLASAALAAAVVFREFILRRQKYRAMLYDSRRDLGTRVAVSAPRQNNKLTLEQNAVLLKDLYRRSDAANTQANLGGGHLEVFESCGEYLALVSRELAVVQPGSPRLVVFRRDKENVEKLRKAHLLAWASVESRMFIREANLRGSVNERVEYSQRALNVINAALEFYPEEGNLLESAKAITSLSQSIKVSHWQEQAERAAFKGDFEKAVSFYKDALFYLAREGDRSPERELLANNINLEINRLRSRLESGEAGRNDTSATEF
jgi:hypothetical protein